MTIIDKPFENFGQFRKNRAKLQPKFYLKTCMIVPKPTETARFRHRPSWKWDKKELESKIKSYIMERREEGDYETLL